MAARMKDSRERSEGAEEHAWSDYVEALPQAIACDLQHNIVHVKVLHRDMLRHCVRLLIA